MTIEEIAKELTTDELVERIDEYTCRIIVLQDERIVLQEEYLRREEG